MTDRFPLIVDSTTGTVKELPSGDNLNLSGSNIINADFSGETSFDVFFTIIYNKTEIHH